MPLKVEDMCRTCMLDGTMKKEEFAKIMVPLSSVVIDMLRASVPQLKVEPNDKLPQNICLDCTNKVKEIHQFQENCLKVERQYNDMLQAPVKSDDEQSLFDMFEKEIAEGEKLLKAELEEDVFVDEQSFHSDQFKDEGTPSDEPMEMNEDEFIQSCSDDLSIDFVLDEDSDSDYEDSKKDNSRKSKIPTIKKSTKPKNESNELYPCTKCKKKLKTETSLKRHLELHEKRSTVDRERKCVCNICDRGFPHAYMLRDHLRSHSGEKPYLCSECGKGFTTSSSLKQHTFRHNSERQFTCPDCPKAFTTRTDLSSHSVVHKEKPRTHVCDLCGRGFTRAFVLKQHKMYHRNERAFSCEFCEKRFNTNEKLQRHTRIHTGEKPYKCKYCEKAYCQSNELTKHLRFHLGENVYQCALCPQRFATVKLVKEHFILHKNDDPETREQNVAALNALEIKGIFTR
uniref:Protein krueppel n=1 Tax=Stomoxys calcitrans TaxID=35570 RepID=A0A1I8NYW4_STOCA